LYLLDQLNQPNQVINTERRTPSANALERVGINQVGPAGWHRAQASTLIVVVHTVTVPILSVLDDLELPSTPWMERVSDFRYRSRWTRFS
jgi:hypothetical protein